MKQLLQNLRTGETYVADVPTPTPKPGTALVRTATSLVSAGTERMVVEFAEKSLVGKVRARPDLFRQLFNKARSDGILTTIETAFDRLDQPMPLGYSSAGTIVAVGEGLQGFQVGQRVACAGGGYAVHAEYAIVPKNLLAPLPDEVDLESAAFATLGAVAMHGFRLPQLQLGERVAVIGLGLLGFLTVGIARAAGCHVLGIDLDPERVARGDQRGIVVVHRDQAVEIAQSFSHTHGLDAVIICADTASNDPVNLAGEIARDRARVVAVGNVGLDIPRKIYFDKELTFMVSRSYGPGRYDLDYEEGGQDYPIGYVRWTEGRNLEAFIDLLADGRLDVKPLITHRFPIEDAHKAYRSISGKQKESFLGVLLTYPKHQTDALCYTHYAIRNDVKRNAYSVKETSSVKLGVLGAGNFATTVLLPAIKKIPNLERVGIASTAGLSAQSAAKRFGFGYASSDETDILNDPNINTIVILTRHHLHAKQVIAALQAGKHVFCEKPLAVNSEQLFVISEQLPLITDYRLLITVGFNRRFAPLAQHMHAFLADRSEPLMAHYRINAGYLPHDHWLHDPEQGGGRIIGEGCHFVDFLTFLVGAPPITVTAHALPDTKRYREDNIHLTFTFSDDSLGAVTYLANGDKTFPKERVEVFAGGRVAVLDNFRSLETIHKGKRKTHRSRLRQDKGHRAEWEAFVQAVATGGPPPIPYEHLIGVTRATFAAVEATRKGEPIAVSNQFSLNSDQ